MKFITFEEFVNRSDDDEYFVADWGGWSTLKRSVEKNVANTFNALKGGEVHESDFMFFKNFSDSGLFLDVGASMGFSAISFSNVNQSMNILSMEIIPFLEGVLKAVTQRIGPRASYLMSGAGRDPGVADIYVPVLGSLYCSPLTSMSFNESTILNLQREIDSGGRGVVEVMRVPASIIKVDDLGLKPSFVKIDAEQHEHDVLLGMADTTRRCLPVFMLESGGAQDEHCRRWFQAIGYDRYLYSSEENCLLKSEDGALNAFFVPREKIDWIRSNNVEIK